MKDEGPDNETRGTEDAGSGLNLDAAATSIASARTLLKLRQSVGRNLRAAIRCLLEAQERLENNGPTSVMRLDLLEAIRLIGAVEHEMKGPDQEVSNQVTSSSSLNRRAFHRFDATYQVQLEPEFQFSKSDLPQLPISGMTLNVSKGGMLATIDQGVLRHGRYLVRFLRVGESVKPEIMWGAVRRSRARNSGWEVGIEFDTPLEFLQ
ncbi:MAG: PilZ domain-containing protein [Acidobacteriota bacterium]